MAGGKSNDWRELCLAAAKEEDTEKLTHLVNDIIEAFDQSLHRPGDSGSVLCEGSTE